MKARRLIVGALLADARRGWREDGGKTARCSTCRSVIVLSPKGAALVTAEGFEPACLVCYNVVELRALVAGAEGELRILPDDKTPSEVAAIADDFERRANRDK